MIPSTHAKDSVPALYQRALQCDDAEERCRLLKEAAEAGYILAICDYGLMCEDSAERKHWLLEAACEGHVPAMYHYRLGQPRHSRETLRDRHSAVPLRRRLHCGRQRGSAEIRAASSSRPESKSLDSVRINRQSNSMM
jgi:hypothetical protein